MFTSTFAGMSLFSMSCFCGPTYKSVPQFSPPCHTHEHAIVVHYGYFRMSPYHGVYHPPAAPVLPTPKAVEPKKNGL